MSTSSSSEPVFESALYELLIALQSPVPDPLAENDTACVVCRLTTRSVLRWLQGFLAEYVNDPATRETLRRAQGFCELHTRQLAASSDALAIAILYADLARLTRERWEQKAEGNRTRIALLRRLRGGAAGSGSRAPCPACITQQEAQQRYVHALAAGLERAEVWKALETNSGLCVAHVQQVLKQADPDNALRLKRLEIQRMSALQDELERIVRKNDYRYREEPWGAEKDAWRRALDRLRRP